MLRLKKIAAILFFAVLAFNWFGYRFVIQYLQQQHDRDLETMLDQHEYTDADLISIKAPFSVPYLSGSDQFERWNGEIEIEGIRYKYVKRRFFQDSIELLCLPDYKSARLESAKENFFRFANDLVQHEQSHKTNNNHSPLPSYKNLMSEFCQPVPVWDFGLDPASTPHHARYLLFTQEGFADNQGQPPDCC